MGRVLVIAEKPSVGRDIAKVLKCSEKKEGYIQGEKYIVSWALGHLLTLYNPEDYSQSLKKWSFSSLPIIPETIKIKPVKKTSKQLNVLKALMLSKETDAIVCATDSGREGELIFRYIYTYTKCKKTVKRLWISSMTDTAIKEGFNNLKDINEYDNIYLSAKCRAEADWIVGINATRAYSIKYNSLLSVGRVQTPTLAIIVNRQKEIDEFVPTDYYEIKSYFQSFFGMWIDNLTNDSKISDIQKADEILKKVEKEKTAIVNSIKKEEKSKLPPFLYDLTELQRDCNKKFGFSAQKTLNIAQSLYESKKLITYPRTDSRFLSSDMIPKLKQTVKNLCSVKEYEGYAQYLLSLENIPISKRIIDNSKISDHHAIIPTDSKININSLSNDEAKVYDLIVLRFLSVFYPKYVYSVTKVFSRICDETFLSKGKTVISEGFMSLYKNNLPEENSDLDNQIIPDLKEGDILDIVKIQKLKKKTKPLPNYTEATLLSAMENAGKFTDNEELKEKLKESGLGTPATRASIIERLIAVGYIYRKGKLLIPAEKGVNLIKIAANELKSPETTGKWEKGLSSISKGKMQREKFMESIGRYVNYLINDANNLKAGIVFENTVKPKSAVRSFGKCPLCGEGKIYENAKAFYCSNWKEKSCKFTIWKNSLDSYGAKVDGTLVRKLLKDKKVNDFNITLPQTHEKCSSVLVLRNDNSGFLELMNTKRID